MKDGKAFGAMKTAVLRVVKNGGYAPEWTQITVFKSDRERLRSYCADNGGLSLVEGFHKILDDAKVHSVRSKSRVGALKPLVDSLRYRAKEFDPGKLAERIRKGEFDHIIREYFNQTNN